MALAFGGEPGAAPSPKSKGGKKPTPAITVTTAPTAALIPTSETTPTTESTLTVTSSPTPEVTASPPPSPVVTATPVTPTQSTTGPVPLGDPNGWKLVFQDEFDGSSLDASKWVTCYPWWSHPSTGCTNEGNKELEWYLPSGVSVSNGTLKLTAKKKTVTGTNSKTYPYTSGMISSGPSGSIPAKFAYQYGFIEAKMKLPAGTGLWPAFSTLPTDTSWPPEVNAMENWGNPTSLSTNVHWRSSSGIKQDMITYSVPDMSAGFHTVGFSWSQTELLWYFDGKIRKTFTNTAGIPTKPMYIILTLAIDGNNPPSSSLPFPRVFEVDYVRAWQK